MRSQSAYIQHVLERFDMTKCRKVTIPFENHDHVAATSGTATNQDIAHYQAVDGSLMYAALGTRVDITFATTFLSQFFSNRSRYKTVALWGVLRYLPGTIELALVNPRRPVRNMILHGFANASHASYIDSRQSFSGNCFVLSQFLINWKLERHKLVAISSTDAEYMALSETAHKWFCS